MKRDNIACLESWSDELMSRADRVRSLIGNAHWLSDGHHKEELVREFLIRHLPKTFRITRGFICPPDAGAKVSPEIDILITDSLGELPWFTEGGLVIAPPSSVLGQIHVKTEYGSKEVTDVLKGNVLASETFSENRPIEDLWSGAIFFSSTKMKCGTDYSEVLCGAIQRLSEAGENAGIAGIKAGHLPRCLAIMRGPVFTIRKDSFTAGKKEVVLVRGWNCGKLSYPEWQEYCTGHKPIWGLLYDEDYPTAETYAYRTRNTVVTEILLRMLDYGSAQHAGQFRCLKTLLGACTSATPAYVTFIQDILVRRRELIENRFTYTQAMDLYDTALGAYPKSFGLVQHHKCLVKKKLGGDPLEVYDALTKLITKSYDRSIANQDSPANLHTSAAAALHSAMRKGEIDTAEAVEQIFRHISATIALDQFSLHTHHVQATTLITIASSLRHKDMTAFMTSLTRAGRIIDKAFALMSAEGRESPAILQSREMFNALREELLTAYPDVEEAKKAAIDSFRKTGNRVGLAFVARILLTGALKSDKGSHFKKVDDFLRECFKLLAEKKADAPDELIMCRIELVANWNLLRNKGPVYWEQFEADIRSIMRETHLRDDVQWMFYLGVATYNQRKYAEAEICFQNLRTRHLPFHLRHVPRCFFLGDKSEPKVFEGTISTGSEQRRFIYSGELGTDVMVRHEDFHDRPEDVKHFKIAFSMYGPLAVDKNMALG